MSNVELANLVRLRMALDARIDEKSRELAAVIDEDKKKLAKIESLISAKMLEQGYESIKTDFGTPYFSLKENFSVEDKAAFMDWVGQENMWHVVPAQILKDSAKEYVKENGGALPPGIKYSAFKKIAFRKPTKKVD